MKTIADCKPTEFLRQTNRIRKLAEKWLKDTNILGIRKNVPDLKRAPDNATDEEKDAINEENIKIIAEQSRKNLSEMLDAVLDDYPDETLELLALCCFVEPEEIDNYTVEDYLKALTGIINNSAVTSFFVSLILRVQTPILPQSKQ